MKTARYLIPSALLLAACASSGDNYMAADSKGDYGYYETALGDERYRVVYKSRGDNPEKARDYALLRASEITLQNGYDWFEVVDRDTTSKQREDRGMVTTRVYATTYRECGVLTCRTVTRPTYIDSAHAENRPSGTESTATILEFVMGDGEKPDGGRYYDAQTLANTIRDRS
ncbi:MAG: hypothetical protein HWE25_07045 [Alphaproteobacteria bacterium]|nr:hypothetical protein [Alphaproteobacteria bacterium]